MIQIMKKNISLTLLVILSGVVFSACNKLGDQAAVTEESTSVVAQQADDGGSFTGNVKGLLGFNKTQKCTWIEPNEGEGVVFVSGKKTRSEIKMLATSDQPAQEMFSISDGEWTYSWDPATKKGMKAKIQEVTETDEADSELAEYERASNIKYDDEAETKEADAEHNFQCSKWKADPKLFIPPTDVEFIDMNAMMDQIRQNPQDMSQICEMLTGKEKAECLAGFEK